MDLKGNIRVMCRMRPFLKHEQKRLSIDQIWNPVVKTFEDVALTVYNDQNMWETEYEFTRVFGKEAVQENVYDEVSPMIVSALDGYNVCIIAYG